MRAKSHEIYSDEAIDEDRPIESGRDLANVFKKERQSFDAIEKPAINQLSDALKSAAKNVSLARQKDEEMRALESEVVNLRL